MSHKGGTYLISVSELDEEDFGPPKFEEEEEELDLSPLGRIKLEGDKVTNLDANGDIQDLIDNTFVRWGEEKDGVYYDYQTPIENGKPGYGEAFMALLDFYDLVYERLGD